MLNTSSLKIAEQFGLLDNPVEWMFYDYLQHPENPMFQCKQCNGLSIAPEKVCPKCGAKMHIPKSAVKYIPEKYRHLWR